jgi:hypothetical protein
LYVEQDSPTEWKRKNISELSNTEINKAGAYLESPALATYNFPLKKRATNAVHPPDILNVVLSLAI